MPTAPSAVELLRALSHVLEQGGWRWYLFGAQAVNVHGRPRMTADVDVTISLERPAVRRFCRAMKRAGFVLRVADPDEFVRATSVLPFVHRITNMPLDVVLAASGLESLFLERAELADVGGLTVPVISAADLVVAKILAGRPKDLDDAEGVLREQANRLDHARVRALVREIELALGQSDLSPLLERAIRQARATRTASSTKRKVRRPKHKRRRSPPR